MPGEKDHASPEAEPLLASGTNDASTTTSKNINESTKNDVHSTLPSSNHNSTKDSNDSTTTKIKEIIPNDNNSNNSGTNLGTSPKNKSLKSSLNSPNSIDKPTKHLLFEVAEETASMNNEMNDGTTVKIFYHFCIKSSLTYLNLYLLYHLP